MARETAQACVKLGRCPRGRRKKRLLERPFTFGCTYQGSLGNKRERAAFDDKAEGEKLTIISPFRTKCARVVTLCTGSPHLLHQPRSPAARLVSSQVGGK